VDLDAPTTGTPSQLLCPFDLRMWAVDRMLKFEIVDDPHYQGLELQVFDDPSHGRGMIVLLRRRRDGRFDIYRQPGLALDPELAQVGGELGAWVEADIDPARFDIHHDGVDVDVRLVDLAGRVVEVRIDDRDAAGGAGGRCWLRSGRPSSGRSRCRCSSWAAAIWSAGPAGSST
jgi:hypothetical protein